MRIMMGGKAGFGPWSELGGWTLALIILVVLIIVIVAASRGIDVSFLGRLGG